MIPCSDPRREAPRARVPFPGTPWRAHDDDTPHFHEISEEGRAALAETIWKAENVELTTVGIDIGSSTSHLMFSRVHLQRKTQLLSSQFVVVSREVLWRSPILLTPFLPDYTIDAARLRAFVDEAYREAGLAPADVDSGAVILTGEAIKRTNAQAIAQIFAGEAGKFVCASAGHHLECVLAAHGSGAAALSRRTHRRILNVDIGGGTTKLALIENGEIRATCALAVGGRLVALDAAGALARVEDPARLAAARLGIDLSLGRRPAPDALDRLADALAEALVSMLAGGAPDALARELMLTEPLPAHEAPHWITFSGGVSEYVYGRERASFGDIAQPLAARILRAFEAGRVRAARQDAGQGIRATVIGASQFSVQVSGKTIHLSPRAGLPLRNVPVLFPALPGHGEIEPEAVAASIAAALGRAAPDESRPVALGIRWHGDPYYARLRRLAEGIARGVAPGSALPLVLMVDGDVGKLLGQILERELGLARPVVSIDGLKLSEFDYVDIGELIEPTQVVPVVIKSLLFPAPPA